MATSPGKNPYSYLIDENDDENKNENRQTDLNEFEWATEVQEAAELQEHSSEAVGNTGEGIEMAEWTIVPSQKGKPGDKKYGPFLANHHLKTSQHHATTSSPQPTNPASKKHNKKNQGVRGGHTMSRRGGFNASTNPAMSRGGHVPGGAASRHHTQHSGNVDVRSFVNTNSPYTTSAVPMQFNPAAAIPTSPVMGLNQMHSPGSMNATIIHTARASPYNANPTGQYLPTQGVSGVHNASGYYNVNQAPLIPSTISPAMPGQSPYGTPQVVGIISPHHSPLNAQAVPFGISNQQFGTHPQLSALPAPNSPQSANTFAGMSSPGLHDASPTFHPSYPNIGHTIDTAMGTRSSPYTSYASHQVPTQRSGHPSSPAQPQPIPVAPLGPRYPQNPPPRSSPARHHARAAPVQNTAAATQTTPPAPQSVNPDLPKNDVEWTINLAHQKVALERALGLYLGSEQKNIRVLMEHLEEAKKQAKELTELGGMQNPDEYTIRRRSSIAKTHLEHLADILSMIGDMAKELEGAKADNEAKGGYDGLLDKLTREEDKKEAEKGIKRMLGDQ